MPKDLSTNCETSRICLLPGMTAAYPVYRRLAPLLTNASIVSFIEPLPNESLTAYAARLAPQFHPDSYIGGVSFGGILALEISRLVRPKGCIVISSVQGPRQLPPWMRRLAVPSAAAGVRVCYDGLATLRPWFPDEFAATQRFESPN